MNLTLYFFPHFHSLRRSRTEKSPEISLACRLRRDDRRGVYRARKAAARGARGKPGAIELLDVCGHGAGRLSITI